jgi:enamine deaminase RidA (YjgF/YER057c/UK114 family)
VESWFISLDRQVPFDKSGNLVGQDDFLAQAEQVLNHIKSAVEAAGGSLAPLRVLEKERTREHFYDQ